MERIETLTEYESQCWKDLMLNISNLKAPTEKNALWLKLHNRETWKTERFIPSTKISDRWNGAITNTTLSSLLQVQEDSYALEQPVHVWMFEWFYWFYQKARVHLQMHRENDDMEEKNELLFPHVDIPVYMTSAEGTFVKPGYYKHHMLLNIGFGNTRCLYSVTCRVGEKWSAKDNNFEETWEFKYCNPCDIRFFEQDLQLLEQMKDDVLYAQWSKNISEDSGTQRSRDLSTGGPQAKHWVGKTTWLLSQYDDLEDDQQKVLGKLEGLAYSTQLLARYWSVLDVVNALRPALDPIKEDQYSLDGYELPTGFFET